MKTKVIVVMLLAVLGLNVGYANELYLDVDVTTGDIDITQTGDGNKIGTDAQSPFVLNGSSHTVSIEQIGDNNILTGTVTGSSVALTNSVTGSGNTQSITCADCSGATITNTIVGSTNTTTQALGGGAGQTSILSITGSGNTVSHTIGDNAGGSSGNITVSGSTNNVTLNQIGTPVLPHQAVINATGTGINLSINQSTP
jgi:hypothetical protein